MDAKIFSIFRRLAALMLPLVLLSAPIAAQAADSFFMASLRAGTSSNFAGQVSYYGYPAGKEGKSRAATQYKSGAAFARAVAQAARATGGEVVLYAHGCCSSQSTHIGYAKSMNSKFGIAAPVVMFDWPSGGGTSAHDQDLVRASQSRKAFGQLIRTLASGGVRRIAIVSHSLGASVAMGGLRYSKSRVSSVTLMSPDLATREFKSLAGGLPQPFIIISSHNDSILPRYGAGGADSLGAVTDPAKLSGYRVTLLDVGDIPGQNSGGHLTALKSSAFQKAVRSTSSKGFPAYVNALRRGALEGVEIKSRGAATLIVLPRKL